MNLYTVQTKWHAMKYLIMNLYASMRFYDRDCYFNFPYDTDVFKTLW